MATLWPVPASAGDVLDSAKQVRCAQAGSRLSRELGTKAQSFQEPRVLDVKRTEALSQLFREHKTFVLRSLRLLGLASEDLDDALQEVFLVVARRIHDYEERGRARAWLYSICIRVVMATRRARNRRSEDFVGDFDSDENPQHRRAKVDHDALVLGQQLIRTLTPEQRDIFWLYEMEQLRMREIAVAKRLPLQTAYSRLHRARQCLLAAANA